MGIGHVLYIPLCVIIGLALGWVMGGKGAAAELEQLRERAEQAERDAARLRVARAESSS